MVLLGNYLAEGVITAFIHEGDVDQFQFDIVQDVSFVSVSVKEPIYYTMVHFSFPFGFNINYDSMQVEVRNTGQIPINHLNIQYFEEADCGMCNYEIANWAFDTPAFFPGDLRTLEIGSLYTYCVTSNPNQLCLVLTPAADLPEIEKTNNRLCRDVNAIDVGIKDPEKLKIHVYPNPASDMIYFDLNKLEEDAYQCKVYDMYGILKEQFILRNQNHSIVNYSPGLYFIRMLDRNDVIGSAKILKIDNR